MREIIALEVLNFRFTKFDKHLFEFEGILSYHADKEKAFSSNFTSSET